jgi:hypothetical protein
MHGRGGSEVTPVHATLTTRSGEAWTGAVRGCQRLSGVVTGSGAGQGQPGQLVRSFGPRKRQCSIKGSMGSADNCSTWCAALGSKSAAPAVRTLLALQQLVGRQHGVCGRTAPHELSVQSAGRAAGQNYAAVLAVTDERLL